MVMLPYTQEQRCLVPPQFLAHLSFGMCLERADALCETSQERPDNGSSRMKNPGANTAPQENSPQVALSKRLPMIRSPECQQRNHGRMPNLPLRHVGREDDDSHNSNQQPELEPREKSTLGETPSPDSDPARLPVNRPPREPFTGPTLRPAHTVHMPQMRVSVYNDCAQRPSRQNMSKLRERRLNGP